MSMDQLRRQIEDMGRNMEDQMDKPHDPAAGRLKLEMEGLENDLQQDKNNYSIEDRIKHIIHILQGEARDAQIMDYGHLDWYRKWFENLRQSFR